MQTIQEEAHETTVILYHHLANRLGLCTNTVRFKASDLKTAQNIQDGMSPVQTQLPAQPQMAQQESEIQAQQQAMQQQQAALAAGQAGIDPNKAAIAATNLRFSELGDYNVIGEVMVLFGNGKVAVEPQYKPQLVQLSQKAKTVDGHVIQSQGLRIVRRLRRVESETRHRAGPTT